MRKQQGAVLGLLTGWALGAFEAGIVFALKYEVVADPNFVLLGSLAPITVNGLAGLLLGLIFGKLSLNFPFRSIFFLGLIVLSLLRLFGGLTPSNWSWVGSADGVNWLWALPGFLVSALCFFRAKMFLDGRTGELPLGKSVVATCLTFPICWVLMFLQGSDSNLSASPLSEIAAQNSPNIVLVTWDTVRSDTLPLYGGEGLDTPELNRFASEGWVLDNMQAVSNITAPSHATMLSGLYPPTHGLRSNGLTGPVLSIPRLPRLLQENGYAVGGFVSGYSLRGSFGFSRDFHIYDDRPVASALTALLAGVTFSSKLAERVLPRNFLPDSSYVPGEVTLQRAQQWYQSTGDTPAFLWAHFYDAHHPYSPPLPYRIRAQERSSEGHRAPDPSVEEEWVLQRGEIERLDDLLGQLRETLEAKDPGLQNTIVMILSDHGECFGEGGHLLNHHYSLFNATQKIFCVLRPAGGAEPLRLSGPSSQVDVMPTFLSLAGIRSPKGLHGEDLSAWAKGGAASDRGIYMEGFQRNLGDKRLQGWLHGDWKFVRTLGGIESLYRADSWSDVNLGPENQDIMNQLGRELDQFLEKIQTNEGIDQQNASDEANLADLGYFDSEEE